MTVFMPYLKHLFNLDGELARGRGPLLLVVFPLLEGW